MFADGQAHREAADVAEGESEEEVVALFQLLPFAFTSSDHEDGVTEESKANEEREEEEEEEEKALPNGPPCHKLQPPPAGQSAK